MSLQLCDCSLSPARTAAFIRQRLSHIASVREPVEPERVSAPGLEAAPALTPDVSPSQTVTAATEVVVPPAAEVDLLAEQLELAQRDALEAERMLVTGIPFGTHSRFGWPGQLLRTAVLRLLRPYAHFEARAHQQHLQSTLRVLECLRRLDGEISPLRGAQSGHGRGTGGET